MSDAAAGITDQSKPDQFFVQAVCAVGGLVLLFHLLLFIGNQAMLLVLQSSQFYPQWPRNYYYLPIVAGFSFLTTAALRNYRPGLSGVVAVQAVIACGVYAVMLSLRTVEQMFISRAREFTPGPGSWILLLLSFIPLLSAGLLACFDSRKFEPLLATFLRSAASACVIILFAPPLWETGTPKAFLQATAFGLILSVFYFVTTFHTKNKRPIAIGASIGYPLAVIPVSFILIALARWGPVRHGETQNMLLLIAANAVLWIVGVSAAFTIRPRQGKRIVAGAAMSFGSAVLAVMLLMH